MEAVLWGEGAEMGAKSVLILFYSCNFLCVCVFISYLDPMLVPPLS